MHLSSPREKHSLAQWAEKHYWMQRWLMQTACFVLLVFSRSLAQWAEKHNCLVLSRPLAQWAEKHNCMQRWMMHILSQLRLHTDA